MNSNIIIEYNKIEACIVKDFGIKPTLFIKNNTYNK